MTHVDPATPPEPEFDTPAAADPIHPPPDLTPDEMAQWWLENVYQGDTTPQLTIRAVITGMLIGGVMSISNLYVGLKTGWGLGVTITACIIAYAVFSTLEKIIPAFHNRPFTILENYTMSSAASAAGYMSSAGLVSAIPALYLTTQETVDGWTLMAWLGAVSALGVFMAIPLKRQLINIDQLPFPSGIATAETLRSMHASGAEAMVKAKALGISALFGGLVGFFKEAPTKISERIADEYARVQTFILNLKLPETVPLVPGAAGERWLSRYSVGWEISLIMVAAGAIMGIRVGASLLLGMIVFYPVLGAWLVSEGITNEGYGRTGINYWTLWPATSMMVTSGLLAFALKWRTVLRAFSGLAAIVSGSRREEKDPLEQIEVPGSWFLMGMLVMGVACVVLGHFRFQITWWMGILAVLLTFLLSIVAARATGETDVTPIGAMGKITQLMYGVIAPKNSTTNLMTAAITSGAASHAADLLTDLKSGYLLGGNPRKQAISQLFGVVAGTLFCVPVYQIVVKPEKLGTPELPAPAAQVWAGVAKLMEKGVENLPEHAVTGIWVGGLVGVVLALAETHLPRKHLWCVPSATGLGIAGVIPAFNSISMFLGALGAWILAKARPLVAERYTIVVSSGLIAGETLVAMGIILLFDLPVLVKALFGIGGE